MMCFTLFLTIFLHGLTQSDSLSQPVNSSQTTENNRIIGGVQVSINNFPYFASVAFESSVICGGVIIEPYAVLTAGHCVSNGNDNSGKYYVFLGSDIKFVGTRYEIYLAMRHRYYNEIDTRNDISLLVTEKKIEFNHQVRAIKIARDEALEAIGTEATTCGLGRISSTTMDTSNRLLAVNIEIVSNTICSEVLRHDIVDSQICAGGVKDRDSCNGDSGGPLVVNYTLIGLVSWGRRCGEEGVPAVYTRVSKFINWIKTVMEITLRNHPDFTNQSKYTECETLNNNTKETSPSFDLQFCYETCDIQKSTKQFKKKCGLLPIGSFHILSIRQCLDGEELHFNISNWDNLKVKFGNVEHSVERITTGFSLLPFYVTEMYDIVIVKLKTKMIFPPNLSPFFVTKSFERTYPRDELLLKIVTTEEEENRETSQIAFQYWPVKIHSISARYCRTLGYSLNNFPFKVIGDMFCILPGCVSNTPRSIDVITCTDVEGSPIFSFDQELVGVLIWQDKCEKQSPGVALHIRNFISAYQEKFGLID